MTYLRYLKYRENIYVNDRLSKCSINEHKTFSFTLYFETLERENCGMVISEKRDDVKNLYMGLLL